MNATCATKEAVSVRAHQPYFPASPLWSGRR
jgi:hypothetical protein